MTTAAPGTAHQGLASAANVEALADQLAAIADALHARVMHDIGSDDDGHFSAAEMAIARALLDDEQVLRQRASSLYADAASCVVHTLGPSQQQLMALTVEAAGHIRTSGHVADVGALVGAVLALAGAAATGQAGAIVVALAKVGKQVKKIAATAPNKAA